MEGLAVLSGGAAVVPRVVRQQHVRDVRQPRRRVGRGVAVLLLRRLRLQALLWAAAELGHTGVLANLLKIQYIDVNRRSKPRAFAIAEHRTPHGRLVCPYANAM